MSTKTAPLLLHPLLRQARFVKRLPRRYIGALLIVALLASVGQILIQSLLSQQADSEHVISLAANQVQTVRLAEIGLFAATLMVLLLEGLFIFAPAMRTLKDNLHSLEKSENRLREAANALAQRNKQLEDAFQEAWQARSKMLLPVRKVSGGYIVATSARDRVVHVTRDASGALMCECSASELGYVCTHILSVSHFQLVAQRAQQQQRERTSSGPQAWGRSQPSQPMRSASQPLSRSQPGQSMQTGSQPWSRSQPSQPMGPGSQPWMLAEPEPPWEPVQSAARSIRQRAQSRGLPGNGKW